MKEGIQERLLEGVIICLCIILFPLDIVLYEKMSSEYQNNITNQGISLYE